MNFWSRIKILIYGSSLPDPGSTHIAMGAKSDGLYIRKPGGTDKKILTEEDSVGGGSSLTTLQITLTVAGWSSLTQTVTVSGMTATASPVIAAPDPAGNNDLYWAESGVKCSARGTNSLTFICHSAPYSDVVVNVAFQV